MMVHGDDQITAGENAAAVGMPRRTAWPDFVPGEMAERFLQENLQTEKVIKAELEPI